MERRGGAVERGRDPETTAQPWSSRFAVGPRRPTATGAGTLTMCAWQPRFHDREAPTSPVVTLLGKSLLLLLRLLAVAAPSLTFLAWHRLILGTTRTQPVPDLVAQN